jgi:hypothetical protein
MLVASGQIKAGTNGLDGTQRQLLVQLQGSNKATADGRQ